MSLVCRVAIDQIVQKIDRDYDYLLPSSFAAKILPGMRVLVPFGKGNVLKKAMVFSVLETSATSKFVVSGSNPRETHSTEAKKDFKSIAIYVLCFIGFSFLYN